MIVLQYTLITLSIAILTMILVVDWRTRRIRNAQKQEQMAEEKQLRTALQEAQAAIETSEAQHQLLKQLLNATQTAIFLFSTDTECTPTSFSYANAAASELLEYEIERILELTPMDIELIPEPDMPRPQTDVDLLSLTNSEKLPRDSVFAKRAMHRSIKNALTEGRCNYESHVITRNGRRIPVAITMISITGGNQFIYIIHDCSRKLEYQKSLKESNERYQHFFQQTLVGAAHYDAQHKLVSVNPACLRIFGCPHKDEFEKFDIFQTDFIPQNVYDRLNQGENASCEAVFDLDAMVAKHQFVSNRRGKAILELFFQNLGFDKDRHPIGHLVQIQDLTELRETEAALKLRESQLQQAEKMEAIGTMTGGIAHDFNNILTPILGYADVGLQVCDKNDRLYEFIREIRTSTLRAKDLVQQILVFSRQTDEATTQIHLAPIIKEVARQQSAALPDSIKVNFAIRTEDDLAEANPTQIHQILTNFATNAAYAMRENGGQLDIQLSQFNMGWRHRQEFPKLKKGTYLRISVRDTGVGIPEDVRERVFTPFFSTKPTGEGTGMGLAVVKGVVDALGGDIAVESTAGEGTVFHVALPLVDAAPIEEESIWESPSTDGERILFVDDEHNIAKMATPMLESLGYRSDIYTNGCKALDHFKKTPKAFDILITDQVMPGMTGAELATAVREIRPELPIIICSGYSEHFSTDDAREMGINAFLQKPISRRELGEAITDALHPEQETPTETEPEA